MTKLKMATSSIIGWILWFIVTVSIFTWTVQHGSYFWLWVIPWKPQSFWNLFQICQTSYTWIWRLKTHLGFFSIRNAFGNSGMNPTKTGQINWKERKCRPCFCFFVLQQTGKTTNKLFKIRMVLKDLCAQSEIVTPIYLFWNSPSLFAIQQTQWCNSNFWEAYQMKTNTSTIRRPGSACPVIILCNIQNSNPKSAFKELLHNGPSSKI